MSRMVSSGPSPRVRGAHRRHPGRRAVLGTIPARAGSTPPKTWKPRLPGDHPRACGEHPYPSLPPASIRGPSPRVRGARGHGPGRALLIGTIPARAGSTLRDLWFWLAERLVFLTFVDSDMLDIDAWGHVRTERTTARGRTVSLQRGPPPRAMRHRTPVIGKDPAGDHTTGPTGSAQPAESVLGNASGKVSPAIVVAGRCIEFTMPRTGTAGRIRLPLDAVAGGPWNDHFSTPQE